jgi:hypothetical protein
MPLHPLVEKMMKEKYGENYDADAQAQYDEQSDRANTGNFASALGDAIAGNKVGSNAGFFDNRKKEAKENTLGKIETARKGAMEDMQFGSQMDESKRKADLSDPNSSASKAFKNSIRTNFPKIAELYGADFENLSAADQERVFQPLQLKEQMDARKETARILASNQSEARKEKQEAKQAVLDEKKEQQGLRLNVPGYDRSGDVLPKDEEAVKFRKATATADQMKQKLQRMKELVKENGSFEWGGKGGQEMESLATEIQLLGKSPELYELGVLAGPDLSLLQRITSDPSGASSLFTRDSTRQQQLDSQMSSIDQKLGATAKSLGYQKAGGGKTIVKTQTNPKTGQKRIVYSDGTTEIIDSVAGGM